MRTKKILKRYNIFNYEFIAEFLQEQHKEGWKLVKILPFGIFCFEECEPEDMVYCIDVDTFSVVDDKTPYLDAFADRGWEFIQMFRNCNFFRKRKDAFVEGEELPVDRLERMKKLKKFCDTRDKSAMILSMVLIPNAVQFIRDGAPYLGGLNIFLVAVLIIEVVYTKKMYNKLRKKYYM